jgi:DNA polymerase III sliding clamp (beta) subunit (PCNA family)
MKYTNSILRRNKMNLTLNTAELQEMVRKAITCVSNNKLIPLTSLMNLKVSGNVFTITTTDATNYFYVSKLDKVDCENFELSVIASLFSRLIQKTTSETVTLTLNENVLNIKGNGNYKMELPMDENGSIIKFPKKVPDKLQEKGTIQLSTVKTILTANKASLATNMEVPSLTNYYCGNKVVTSDRYKICSTNISVFEDARLITPTLMEILGVFSKEEISVWGTDDCVVFETDLERVYAPITDGINDYPIAAITTLVEQEFTSSCTLNKDAVEAVLERLSLFVTPYDKKAIYLTLTKDGALFSSKKSSGSELVPFISSTNFSDYTCCIDIEMLKSQIATQEGDELNLYYGSPIAVKLVNKNITQIVALCEDDRTKEA